MSEKTRKPAGSKPWAKRVARRQLQKSREREQWSVDDHAAHEAAREAWRRQPRRPYLKSSRLAERASLELSERRRQRMLDYHARRRAGLA